MYVAPQSLRDLYRLAVSLCSPHFQWLIGNDQCLVDMRAEGALASKIICLANDKELSQGIVKANTTSAREKFDRRSLEAKYAQMYRSAAAACF